MALARLGEFSRAQQSRSIVIWMLIRKSSRILIVRDGKDAEDSPPRQGEQKGIDHLLSAGMKVAHTNPPAEHDVNSILQDPKQGLRVLRRLLAKPVAGALSLEGRVRQLATLPLTAYELARRKAAKEYGARVDYVDREVIKLRPKSLDETEEAAGVISIAEDEPWDRPVPPLATILDAIAAQLRRFIVMTKEQATAVVLWIAASHLVHSDTVRLERFPKLAVQSSDPESGKSRLLTLIWNTIPRGKLWTNPTGAFLVRVITREQPSLCLDELQYAEDRNLLRITWSSPV
jgi:hypothetical protein